MTDPRDFDRRWDGQMDMNARTGAPTPWGWIAAAVFIVIVLALIFSSGRNTQMASDQVPGLACDVELGPLDLNAAHSRQAHEIH